VRIYSFAELQSYRCVVRFKKTFKKGLSQTIRGTTLFLKWGSITLPGGFSHADQVIHALPALGSAESAVCLQVYWIESTQQIIHKIYFQLVWRYDITTSKLSLNLLGDPQ